MQKVYHEKVSFYFDEHISRYKHFSYCLVSNFDVTDMFLANRIELLKVQNEIHQIASYSWFGKFTVNFDTFWTCHKNRLRGEFLQGMGKIKVEISYIGEMEFSISLKICI